MFFEGPIDAFFWKFQSCKSVEAQFSISSPFTFLPRSFSLSLSDRKHWLHYRNISAAALTQYHQHPHRSLHHLKRQKKTVSKVVRMYPDELPGKETNTILATPKQNWVSSLKYFGGNDNKIVFIFVSKSFRSDSLFQAVMITGKCFESTMLWKAYIIALHVCKVQKIAAVHIWRKLCQGCERHQYRVHLYQHDEMALLRW